MFDLSSAQKMILFSDIDNPNNDAFYLNFRKDYNLDDLSFIKKAINIISSNNLNLRIKYADDGDFKQYYIKEDITTDKFEFIDLSSKTDEEIDLFIKDYLTNPFDSIFDSPLYRWGIFKTSHNIILIGLIHHLLLDGTSLFSLIPREIEIAINNFKNNVEYSPSNNTSYELYVNRELEFLESSEAKEVKQYWLDNLNDYSQDWYEFDQLDLGTYDLILSKDLTDKLSKLNSIGGERISPFVLAFSTLFLYFSKLKDSHDMVWNTSVGGRYFGDDLIDALGMFVNVLPLRIRQNEDLTFKELLFYVKSVLKEGLINGKLQFNNYSADLRNQGIKPGLLSMFSIVSNSTDYGSKFLTFQDKITFPFHVRINKDFSDKMGLQSLNFEFNRNCFSYKQIVEIAKGIENLLEDIANDINKQCSDYLVESNEFFDAEKYFNKLIKSFDAPTIISPDIHSKSTISDFKFKSQIFSKDNVSKELILATSLFNLTKFSFSKDILISTLFNRNINGNEYLNEFNELAFGYNFNTNISVEDYLTEIIGKFNEVKDFAFYPLVNNQNIDFDSEIAFNWDNNVVDLSNYKLILSTIETDNQITLNVEYDSSYYSTELINAFLKAIVVLIEKFNKNSDCLLKDISIASEIDRDANFNIKLANEGVIKDIFERCVIHNPDKTILYAEDGEFSYDELNKKANKIANSLIKHGVEIEDKVMFMMRRDSNLIATVLGIIKAGAAFIPIDPNYPKERINQVLEDSHSKFVIISDGIDYEVSNKINVNELLKEEDSSNPNINLTPDNLAFLIYTSGSTGKPKGVMITHRGISNYIVSHPKNMPIFSLVNHCSKMISISTVSFIVFLREIFATIMNGLPVVFANDEESINPLELAKLFDKTNADAFGSTPTRLLEYLKLPEIQKHVGRCKFLIVGGEGFPPKLYDVIREFSDCAIFNSYGPTEVTIASHGKLITSNEVSAGFPMLNVVDKVMDIDGNQLPPYVTGELYVGGAGIARGYSNNEELTNKLFVKLNGIKYYNTGDLAKKDEFGEVYVLGRNDSQIKLRGLRIELSEIEDTIASYGGINAIKVLVKEINTVEYLCAYYTTTNDVVEEDLNIYLENQLPDYMIPSFYLGLDKFPTTPNGKIDFKNLPLPDIKSTLESFTSPTTKLENELFEIVSNILDIEEFGIDTDLFAVGLTSLSVINLISTISKRFDVILSINKILKIKTIKGIALEIEDNLDFELIDEYSDENQLYPLTSNQLGVYFDCIKNPEKIAYNLPKILRLDKTIDPVKLKESIIKAIELHPYIKTRIVIKDGEILLESRKTVDISNLIIIKEIDELTDESAQEFIQPFDLIDNDLFRFAIYVTKDNVNLLADFHHIIVDGGSLNILFNDIGAIYDGRDNSLFNERKDAFEISLNENKLLKSSLNIEGEKFFNDMISQFDESTILNTDLGGDESQGVLKTSEINMDKDIVDEFCSSQNISQNNLFMAATTFTLRKFNSNENLLISTISNGRSNPDYHNTLGMLVKTLAISFDIKGDLTINEFFKHVNESWFNVLSYEFYPFIKIANKYDIFPDFLYAYHGKIIEDVEFDGKIYPREALAYDSLRSKVAVNIIEKEDVYVILLEYNSELYSEKYMNTFGESIHRIISKWILLKDSLDTIKVKDIAIVDENEVSKFEEVETKLLNELFEKQVETTPNNIALVSSGERLTYDELNRKANRVANALIKLDVKPGSKVLHILNRDVNLIIATLGIIKSGAAFIPLAIDYPNDKIEYIFENSEADFIISDIDLDNSLKVVDLLKEENEENPNPNLDPENIAYMVYTSGSTGKPKGVMISHLNITNLLAHSSNNVFYNVYKDLKAVLGIVTVSFDTSVTDIFMPLCCGSKLVFANDEQTKDVFLLSKLIKEEKPELVDMTPSRLMQYIDLDEFNENLSNFKAIVLGGEPFMVEILSKIREYSDVDIYNAYGPTETTIDSNLKLIKDKNKITVGKELFNYITDVRDLDGKLLPKGVIGELYIGGNGVSKGYYRLMDKTKETFLEINGIPYYKSGDYAIKLDNDEIDIKGRMDNQIKLRGLRIELGEIESVINEYGDINIVITVIKKLNNTEHLCAYYTANTQIDIDLLRSYLSSKLSPYMVPTVFMQLEEMPLTPNGKIDVKNLPQPEIIMEYVAPENDLEALIAQLFADILQMDKVGVTDNFFEIGGTSLLVTKITMGLSAKGHELKYADVFENPTPRKLSKLLSGETKVKSQINSTEITDYNYEAIHRRLNENTMENFINNENEELGNILITGATGFLGIHVLYQFLEYEEGIAYCMLRKSSRIDSTERLKSLLYYYFNKDYSNLFESRIVIVDGDITNKEDFKNAYNYPIDSVINCAGNVKHFSSGTDIEDINTLGVINGLEFAELINAKYIQVSTTSVCGESVNNYPSSDFILNEQSLFAGQALDNQYLSSKFLAERAVLEKATYGLNAKVIRVGNLMAREEDSEFQINFESNGFVNSIKSFITLGVMPYDMLQEPIEFSQIDIVAESIIALAKTPTECCLFNSYNNHIIFWSDIVNILKSLGFDLEIIDRKTYNEIFEEMSHDETKQAGLSGLLTAIGMGSSANRELVDVENHYTTNVLFDLGIFWPIITKDYVYNFISYLNDFGFFDI